MADFTIKTGDRLPAYSDQLLDEDGTPVSLEAAGTAVWFVMRASDSDTVLVNAPAVIDDAALGQVSFFWRDGDTDEPGNYLAEWRVVNAAGLERSFPPDRQLVVEVSEDVPSFPTLEAADLAWMRQWVGANPPDGELAEAVDFHGSTTAAALAILRQRRADILSQPISLTIPGDLSVNYGDNVKALDAAVVQLEGLVANEEGTSTLAGAQLVREGGGWGR